MSSESGADRVAVLVVHGVAAKVPNREFVNLEAITDLLTFQDSAKLNAVYRLNEPSTVKFAVSGLPQSPQTPAPDAGVGYTNKLVSDFKAEPYPYTTRRNELTRNGGESSRRTEVHVHEFFWADLSRPASPTGLHSIAAFLRLIYSVCILGPKSLPREEVTRRAGRRGFYRVLYGVQYAISWMTRRYIPIVATAFLAGILSLYLLTQNQPTVDAVVPVLAGLSVMIGFAVWCCTSKDRAKRWQAWLLSGVLCTGLSVVLAIVWFGLGVELNWKYWLGEFYILVSFLITGYLVVQASSDRRIWFSGGLLLIALALTIITVDVSKASLMPATLIWTDWFFAAYWYGWLALCVLNLFFWLVGGACLLTIKKDFLEHARGIWTGCIAGTMPMAMCIVVHLGFFEAICVLFPTAASGLSRLTLPVLPMSFVEGVRDLPANQDVLAQALMYWRDFTYHPAIQYVYLFLILAGALAFCAALPSITAEISPRLRASDPDSVALGAATTQMFDLLRLSGEMVQRYIVIAIPVVVLHVGHIANPDHILPVYWCWVGMAMLGLLLIGSRVYHKRRAQTPVESLAMFAARILIVVACFALPIFEDQINLTWLLGVSSLFILAGAAFLFAPLVSVGVDVTSWLQEYPTQNTPRARILARLIALLDHLKKERYSGVAIVAHSQGTMVVIEALRYLDWADRDRYQGLPMSLFTLGCPLRQLYAVRFPWLYDWAGLTEDLATQQLKAPPQIISWTNAYGSGDYIGRNLWRVPIGTFNVGQPPPVLTPKVGENRREFCLGAWAHVHYWDWGNLQVAKEIDNLIVALRSDPAACAQNKPLMRA